MLCNRFRAVCEQSLVNRRPVASTTFNAVRYLYVIFTSADAQEPLARNWPWRRGASFTGNVRYAKMGVKCAHDSETIGHFLG